MSKKQNNITDDIYLKNHLGFKKKKSKDIKSIVLFLLLNISAIIISALVFLVVTNNIPNVVTNNISNVKIKIFDGNKNNNENRNRFHYYTASNNETSGNVENTSFDYNTTTYSDIYKEDYINEDIQITDTYTEIDSEENIENTDSMPVFNDILYGIVNTEKDPLNMRSQPSIDSEVLTKIPKNTKIEIVFDYNEWLLVKYLDFRGYVSKEYVIISDSNDVLTNNQIDESNTQTGIVITEKDPLNVRESPSMQAKLLGTVPKDERVVITADNGEWYEIEYGNGKGYVSKKYVKITD